MSAKCHQRPNAKATSALLPKVDINALAALAAIYGLADLFISSGVP
jgi:hypothetical protein